MAELVLERDEEGRVYALRLRGDETAAGLAAEVLVDASLRTLRNYLHLAPQVQLDRGEMCVTVDRSDPFLDREVDAVVEMLVWGVRALKERQPEEFAFQDATPQVKV